MRTFGLLLIPILFAAMPAHATRFCAWMVETLEGAEDEQTRGVKLWFEADEDVSFLYAIGGKGLSDGSGYFNSPSSGTFGLTAGEPKSGWGIAGSLYPPAAIDVVADVHAYPEDIFDEKKPPLLATFTFARAIPEGETAPPATLAEKQCRDLVFPPVKHRFAE
ncbi:hypothetical protein ACFB49_09950 [Sphingomonas sp. DBB INV C78]|uniref:hypothetical protein n=1 Tax=Sphingomonas sp. DBB INV C78 TaxID=3349434 RepID=UPI0036D23D87